MVSALRTIVAGSAVKMAVLGTPLLRAITAKRIALYWAVVLAHDLRKAEQKDDGNETELKVAVSSKIRKSSKEKDHVAGVAEAQLGKASANMPQNATAQLETYMLVITIVN